MMYLTADGAIHGTGVFDTSINQWKVYDQYGNWKTNVPPGNSFLPNNFYVDGKLVPSSAVQGLDMRIYFIDKSSKCEDSHNGRFIRGTMYCTWSSESANLPFQYMFDSCVPREIGTLSDKWSKAGINNRWYFFGKDNLKRR